MTPEQDERALQIVEEMGTEAENFVNAAIPPDAFPMDAKKPVIGGILLAVARAIVREVDRG